MKLSQRQIKKIDPLLQDALRNAQGNEVLRAVMLLGSERETAVKNAAGEEVLRGQFGSREAYRRALIAQHRNRVAEDIGDTIRALKDLSLSLRGGTIARVVVVEGVAARILSSLELPGVCHASLDQPVQLIEPRSRGRKKPKLKAYGPNKKPSGSS